MHLRRSRRTCLSRHQGGACKDFQIIGESGRVSHVLEVGEHLVLGEHLSRVLARKLEKLAQQRRLCDRLEEECQGLVLPEEHQTRGERP